MSTKIWYVLEVPHVDHGVQTYTGKVRFSTTEEIDIDDVKTEVKNQSENSLRHVDANMLQVFNGKHIDEELNAMIIWNPELHGGGPSDPLIVKAPLPVVAQQEVNQIATAVAQGVAQALEAFKPALDFSKTDHKPMSRASETFAQNLLRGMGIKIEEDAPNTEGGSNEDPSPHSWTDETTRNETVNIGEHQGTPGACNWFRGKFIGANSQFDLKVVTDKFLPTLEANNMRATGKGDVVIGKKDHLKVPVIDPYCHAYGLIELKSSRSDLKKGQNVLELTALAKISRLKRNVAVLATDCGAKWELCYFKSYSTIVRRGYLHGRKCFEDFMKLLVDADTRELELDVEPPTSRFKPSLSGHEEEDMDDQSLSGFDLDVEKDGKRKAVELQAMLENLANQLGELYGERPIVPVWARAETTCPEYYS